MGEGTNLKDRLERIKSQLEEPVKLSETEKEKFRHLFEELKSLLDDTLEIMLGMSRDEAYRYRNLLIQHLQQVDVDFVAGVRPVKEDKSLSALANLSTKPKVRPDPEAILEGLPEPKRKRALEILGCMRDYRRLKEDGEDASGVLCDDCSSEKMLLCLNTEDPTVVDEMDADLSRKTAS